MPAKAGIQWEHSGGTRIPIGPSLRWGNRDFGDSIRSENALARHLSCRRGQHHDHGGAGARLAEVAQGVRPVAAIAQGLPGLGDLDLAVAGHLDLAFEDVKMLRAARLMRLGLE